MADQCIVCLENLETASPVLDDQQAQHAASLVSHVSSSKAPARDVEDGDDKQLIAHIKACGHVLHDECLREWIQKANSCPICRQAFNLVQVYDKVGGVMLSDYEVADKKQVAEFDPAAWIDEEADMVEEESTPCPICGSGAQEEVLMMCDSCDAPYHTHCVGLDRVPHGHWFCMECVHNGANDRAAVPSWARGSGSFGAGPRTFAEVRLQSQLTRRAHEWQGAWNEIAGQVYEATDIDLDDPDDDQSFGDFRRLQRRRASSGRGATSRREWQQRYRIANRQGAGGIFRQAAQPILRREQSPPPEQIQESEDVTDSWAAFEVARELETQGGSSSRKRKSRSITASPAEPENKEPERKLKRPRRRRVTDVQEPPSDGMAESSNTRQVAATYAAAASSSSSAAAATTAISATSHAGPSGRRMSRPIAVAATDNAPPSFLSSLLKEVEMTTTNSEEEGTRFNHSSNAASATSPSIEHSSPAASPTSSNHPTPRAMSTTPPPHITNRPGSPLPLTSTLMPRYHHSEYSPNHRPPPAPAPMVTTASHHNQHHHDPHNSDHETAAHGQLDHSNNNSNNNNSSSPKNATSPLLGSHDAATELRQPRPRRRGRHSPPAALVATRVEDDASSPLPAPPRSAKMPYEAKAVIMSIVKKALAPYWKVDSSSASAASGQSSAANNRGSGTGVNGLTGTNGVNGTTASTTATTTATATTASNGSSAANGAGGGSSSTGSAGRPGATACAPAARLVTKEQYEAINRAVSRLLYDEGEDPAKLLQGDGEVLRRLEGVAWDEVVKRVEGLCGATGNSGE